MILHSLLMNMTKRTIRIVLSLATLAVIASVIYLAITQTTTQQPTITTTTPNPNLPPDPGEAGKQTLAGIDANNNGVRDDVERYIMLTYPDSEKVQQALMQYARAMQKALLDAGDKEKSMQHFEEVERAAACLWYTSDSLDKSINMSNDVLSVILNTDERNYAYFQYADQLGGEVFGTTPYDQRKQACDFDVDSLQN